jgi:hypothetical protein
MISTNVEAVAKQLQEYRKTMERKLTNMVAGFAENVALAATDATPVGNAGDLAQGLANNSGSAGSYAQLYLMRSEQTGIAPEVGFHAGAWRYSASMNLVFDPNIYAPEQAISEVLTDARASYKVGQTFYIGASGPGYGELNQGSSWQAPNGIVAPAMQQIQAVYSADLKRYYDLG